MKTPKEVDINQKPAVCIAGVKSGSGKTLITCALIQALRKRGYKVQSFKAGPDYIDPLFHDVLASEDGETSDGTDGRVAGDAVERGLHKMHGCENLDTYLAGYEGVKEIFKESSSDADIAVIEGVMGLYDGIGAEGIKASTYDVASCLKAPVILTLDARGAFRSVLAQIKGFLDYDEEALICGVILNRCSPAVSEALSPVIEKELGIRAFGFMRESAECAFESRYLGLALPDEVVDIKSKLRKAASFLEKDADIDGIIEAGRRLG